MVDKNDGLIVVLIYVFKENFVRSIIIPIWKTNVIIDSNAIHITLTYGGKPNLYSTKTNGNKARFISEYPI